MSRLHPVSWLCLVVSLTVLVVRTDNWLIGLVVLGALHVLVVVGFDRVTEAVAWGFTLGVGLLVVHMVLGVLVGRIPEQPTVLFFLPEWTPGQGVRVGGPVSVEQIGVAFHRGLTAAVVVDAIALLGHVKRPPEWAVLARACFGRAGQLIEPAIWLGPALDDTVGVPLTRRPGAVADACLRSSRAFGGLVRRTVPSVRHAVLVAVTLIGATGLLALVAGHGADIVLPSGATVHISPQTVLVAGLVVWTVSRALFSRTLPRLRPSDGLALAACALLLFVVLGAGITGEASALAAPPVLTQLPWGVLAAVVLAVTAFVTLGRTAAHG